MSNAVYQFDEFELNWDTRELFWQGEPVAVEPQAFELIHYLLRHRDRAVAKDELVEALWPERVISDSVISQTVRKARIALKDDGEQQKAIQTVRGFGYRFVGKVADSGDRLVDHAQLEHPKSGLAHERGNGFWRPAGRTRLVAYLAATALLVGVASVVIGLLQPGAERGLAPLWATPDQPAIVAMLPFHHDQASVSDRALAQSLTEALHMRLAELSGVEIRSPRVVGLLLEDELGMTELIDRAEVDFLLFGTLEPALAADRRELGLELAFDRGGSLQAVPLGRFSIPFPDSIDSLAEFMQARDVITERLLQTLLPAMARGLADSTLGTDQPAAFRLLLAAIREVRSVQCDSREVDDLLDRAIEIDPSFDHARMARAWVSYAQYRNCGLKDDHLLAASAQIEQVLARNAAHPVALLINTLIQVENGMIEEAYLRLAPVLNVHPTSPQLRLSLAHALTFAGFLEVACDELDALIANDPLFLSFEKPHLPLAYLYQGRLDDFIRAAPSLDTPTFRYYRAVAELMRGDAPAARALLEPAARGNPTDLSARMSQALLAVLDDRPEAAVAIIEDLDPASADRPRLNGETLFQLGRLLHRAGAQEQALDRFEHALDAGFFCLACLKNDPELAALSEHPRWMVILEAARQRQLAMVEMMGPGYRLSQRGQRKSVIPQPGLASLDLQLD